MKAQTKGDFQCFYMPVILTDSIEMAKTILLQCLQKNIIFIEDIESCCSNSDGEYYNRECINLFLEGLKKEEIFLAWEFKVPS